MVPVHMAPVRTALIHTAPIPTAPVEGCSQWEGQRRSPLRTTTTPSSPAPQGGLRPSTGAAELGSSPRKLASAEGYLFSASAQHTSVPTPRTFTFWSQNGLCWGVKTPEMGMTLDSPGGPVPSQGHHKREGEGQRQRDGNVVLMAVRVEGGAVSQGCSASRSWKTGEPVLPWSLWRDGPCPHLDLAP